MENTLKQGVHELSDDRSRLAETRRSLPMALLRAREAVMECFRPMLNTHGVTEQQWRVIRVLEESGTVDASALSRMAAILPPSLTRILRALELRGVIALARDPSDGRRQQITLTDQGRALMAKVTPESAAIYAALETSIGAGRIDRLLDELDDVIAQIRRVGG